MFHNSKTDFNFSKSYHLMCIMNNLLKDDKNKILNITHVLF